MHWKDTNSKDFVKIDVLLGGKGPNHKFTIKLNKLLKETGSFYVRNTKSLIASKSTGWLDLTAKKSINFKSSGISPTQCNTTESGEVKLEWAISETVESSCRTGYQVLTKGPKIDYRTVPCGTKKITLKDEITDPGQYEISISSRENNELGAWFLVAVNNTSISCDGRIFENVTYTWSDDKLKVNWSNIMNSDEVYFDKYQIILKGINSDESYVEVRLTTYNLNYFRFV